MDGWSHQDLDLGMRGEMGGGDSVFATPGAPAALTDRCMQPWRERTWN